MTQFRFFIEARRKNAIGIKQKFVVLKEGETREAAELTLYDDYEHINITFVEVIYE